MQISSLGFNGERADPVSGAYHLGNGYRAYNPTLMRFTCPDSMSPFGAGGINPYAYCVGDPINLTDPSGHLSNQAIAGIVLGGIGIGLALWTGYSSIVAAGGIIAAMNATSITALAMGTAGLTADVIGIVSDSMESDNPQLSATLGWVSLGLGGAAFIGAGGATIAHKWSTRTSAMLKQAAKNSSSEIAVSRIAPDRSYAYLVSEKKLSKIANRGGVVNHIGNDKMRRFGSNTIQASTTKEGAAYIQSRMLAERAESVPFGFTPAMLLGDRTQWLYELNYSGLEAINLRGLSYASLRDTFYSWGTRGFTYDFIEDSALTLIKGPVPAEKIKQIGTVDWEGNISSFITTTAL